MEPFVESFLMIAPIENIVDLLEVGNGILQCQKLYNL